MVIADYLVNEIFGDNMITLNPDDVKQQFGPLFAQKLLVTADERACAAEILEQCTVSGGRSGTEAAGLYGVHL